MRRTRVAEPPLSDTQITEGLELCIEIGDKEHIAYDVGEKTKSGVQVLLSGNIIQSFQEFQDAFNQVVVNKTIGPHLRHERDHGVARTIAQSHMWWYGGLLLSIIDRVYNGDTAMFWNSEFYDMDSLRRGMYAYVGMRMSQNINFSEHSHTAHCRLTENPVINEFLDHSLALNSGHPAPIWAIDHGFHHSPNHQEFGGLTQDDLHPWEYAGDYFVVLRKDGIKSLHTHVTTSAYILNKAIKYSIKEGGLGPTITRNTPQDKIDLAICELQAAGFDTGVDGGKIVMDTTMEMNYGKEALKLVGQYAGMIGIILINPVYAGFYAMNAILTNCTDFQNHVTPDGKELVYGMNNLHPDLAKNVDNFGSSHTEHHDLPSGLHQSYLAKITQKRWNEGKIPRKHFTICGLQAGAEKHAFSKTVSRVLVDQWKGTGEKV